MALSRRAQPEAAAATHPKVVLLTRCVNHHPIAVNESLRGTSFPVPGSRATRRSRSPILRAQSLAARGGLWPSARFRLISNRRFPAAHLLSRASFLLLALRSARGGLTQPKQPREPGYQEVQAPTIVPRFHGTIFVSRSPRPTILRSAQRSSNHKLVTLAPRPRRVCERSHRECACAVATISAPLRQIHRASS